MLLHREFQSRLDCPSRLRPKIAKVERNASSPCNSNPVPPYEDGLLRITRNAAKKLAGLSTGSMALKHNQYSGRPRSEIPLNATANLTSPTTASKRLKSKSSVASDDKLVSSVEVKSATSSLGLARRIAAEKNKVVLRPVSCTLQSPFKARNRARGSRSLSSTRIGTPTFDLKTSPPKRHIAKGTTDSMSKNRIASVSTDERNMAFLISDLSSAGKNGPTGEQPRGKRAPSRVRTCGARPERKALLSTPLPHIHETNDSSEVCTKADYCQIPNVVHPTEVETTSMRLPRPNRRCAMNFYVDVRTAGGDDASSPFVDTLRNLGASVSKEWYWNDVSSGHAVPKITHVVYKDGSPKTLSKARMAKGAVKCVSIAWVKECQRQQEWIPEEDFLVDLSSPIARRKV